MSIDKVIESLPGMSEKNREKLRNNAEAMRDNGKEGQVENAERVLQALIDVAAEEKQARYDALSAMSMAERVQDVFITSPATNAEAKAITALIDNPNETSSKLTSICGWKTQSWQTYFGNMCKKREAVLWPDNETDSMTASKMIGLLVDENEETNGLTMKPDVEEIFRKMGHGTKRRRSKAARAAA